jgi:hypothetical protein
MHNFDFGGTMCAIDWTAVAAWVQAIGSIVAILAAICIGERSSQRSRDLVENERKRQADILASTIALKLHLVLVEVRKKSARATTLSGQVSSGLIQEITQESLKGLFLLVPHDGLTQLRSNIMLFDRDSGILTNTALDMLDGYNSPIETSIALYEHNGKKPSELKTLCDTVSERLGDVEELCSKAESHLEIIHGLNE